MARLVRKLLLTAILLLLAVVLPSERVFGEYLDIDKLRGLVGRNPYDVSLWNALGIEQAKLGDLAGAVNTWVRGVEVDPGYFHLYNNIGSALRRMGNLREAAQWYQASLRIKPAYWTYYNLGLLYEDMRQIPDAVAAHQAAIAIFPGFFQAREHLARLQREEERNAPEIVSSLPPIVFSPVSPDELSETSRQALAGVVAESGRPATGKRDAGKSIPEGGRSVKPAVSPTVSRPEFSDEMAASPVVRRPRDVGGPVFITFDGGADAAGIPEILFALRTRKIRCTFFLTGKWAERYPELALQILADGHEIGNHSMTHPNMSSWDKDRIAREIEEAEDAFRRVLGRPTVRYFRFPFGAQNARVEGIVRELGFNPVYWDIDTLDWKEPPVSSIVSKVREKLKPAAVILMHCGSKNGAKSLNRILDEVLGRGYQPTTLSRYDPSRIAAISS
jgi:peptidoglycan/xylan/chitin deacetylase (PgdA/CDA1 family)